MADVINTIIDKQVMLQLDELTKKLEASTLALVSLIDTAGGAKAGFQNIQLPKDLDSHLKKISAEREKLVKAVEKERTAELALQSAREKAFDDYEKRIKKEQAEREKQVKAESDLRTRLANQRQRQEKQEQEEAQKTARIKQKAYQDEVNAAKKKAREDVLQVENQKILARNAREAALLSSSLATAYQKEGIRLTQLRRQYKDVALAKGENSKEARKLQAEILKLDARLKRIDANVGQFQRSVGNYSKAWRSLGNVVRSTAAAFGLMGGAFLAVRVLRDGANRIREFDKELQNIAGVTGQSREELRELEDTIIAVAGASVRTSNEVAKLATAMITLGKTESEVKLLLAPVNDLSIGLRASSEDAGELLIQTLNAFGKGAESGQEYADIIANVRQSTSLDFQRIRDSLSYVSATGNALGLSLEQIMAILGVLSDNSIKAARAGRLMNSTFGRLNASGTSLQEALEAINNSTNKAATATELFGTESFSLGLILAANIEKTEKYTKAFEDSAGSLDDLVNEQLKSMDAQIKILDSAWEKFILTFDNGTGRLSRGLATILGGITKIIEAVTWMNDDGTFLGMQVQNRVMKEQADYYEELGDEAKAYAEIDRDRAEEAVRNAEIELDRREKISAELRRSIEENKNWMGVAGPGQKEMTDRLKENEEASEALRVTLGRLRGERDAAIAVIGVEASETEKLNAENEDLNETIKDSEIILAGSVSAHKAIISELQSKRDRLATNSTEYAKYTAEIEENEAAIRKLTEAHEALNDIYAGEGTTTGSFGSENDVNAYQQHLRDNANKEVEIEQEKQDAIDWLRRKGIENAEKLSNDHLEAIQDGMKLELALHQDFENAKKNLVIESLNAIGEARVESVNREIEENQRRYAQILEDDQLSEEQRSYFEAERDRKEAELQEKKRKREREAFLISQGLAVAQIALNLAQTIAAINLAAAAMDAITPFAFGATGAAFRAANIPLAIGTAAAQTAVVVAQTIPKYKHGRSGGKAELAMVGDGGRSEVVTDKDGNFKRVTSSKPEYTYLDRGDKVYSSLSSYKKSPDYDSLIRASMLTSLYGSKKEVTGDDFDRALMQEAIEAGIKAGFQNVNMSTTVNNDNAALLRELKNQRRRDV